MGDTSGGNYLLDSDARWVSVCGGNDGQRIHTVFREGIGCEASTGGSSRPISALHISRDARPFLEASSLCPSSGG